MVCSYCSYSSCSSCASCEGKCTISTTKLAYKRATLPKTFINKYNVVDCSGSYVITDHIPPYCGTCPLKLNIIPRSPYRSIETPMSVYTSDISSLNVYQNPNTLYHNVNWNQSSDRAIPHIQPTNVQRNSSSLRGTRTSLKPGATVPGGVGVDIKHNSFNRYNLRLRGAVLKTKKQSSNILKFPAYKFKSDACYKCDANA